MNTDATAALAAALQTILSDFDREPDDEYMAVAVPMFLSLIDGWTLVNDVDFHAELTDDELATCAAMNFGEGLIEGRKEGEAEIDRLRAALEYIRDELGVPDSTYPMPVWNAATKALAALAPEAPR